MPTYVYKFIDSGETIDVQQAFTDEAFTTLADPVDGTIRAVKKVFTPVGVSFKGGGFYKTDSRSGSHSTSSTAATTPAATTASNGDSTSTPASTSTPSTTPATTPSTPPAKPSATSSTTPPT